MLGDFRNLDRRTHAIHGAGTTAATMRFHNIGAYLALIIQFETNRANRALIHTGSATDTQCFIDLGIFTITGRDIKKLLGERHGSLKTRKHEFRRIGIAGLLAVLQRQVAIPIVNNSLGTDYDFTCRHIFGCMFNRAHLNNSGGADESA